MNSLDEETFLTRQDLCQLLHLCLSSVDKLDVPKIKIGRSIRFKKSDVDAWLSKQMTNEEKPKQSIVTVKRSLTVAEEEPWP